MKILWHSNAPWATTGYGNQTKLFVPRLTGLGHEVAISAFYGHHGTPITMTGDILVYGGGNHPYGQDIMAAHAAHYHANIIITLIDAWVIEPQTLAKGQKWVPWFPVDHDPLPPPVRDKVRQAYRRIVFSRFGEKMVNDAGMDCYYVPHGVDTAQFRPIPQAEARKTLGWHPDKFIVGMVAANKGSPSRKAFMGQLEAFAEFRKRHDDAELYLHTYECRNGEYNGVNLPEFVEYMGLTDAVTFADQYSLLIGFNDEYMANMYSALDVHLLVSMGEGFGIPTVEAQACGCPVIVGDWTASGELCFSGWKVDKRESVPFWTPIAAYQYLPQPGAIVERLEMAYRMRGNQDYRKRARKGALAYDADKVAEKYWQPVLAEIEQAASVYEAVAA